jgi:hypothetical protein
MKLIVGVLLCAALGSVAAGAPAGTSPFEASYAGLIPGAPGFGWSLSVSSGGRITGSGTGVAWVVGNGSVTGKVSDDGRLSLHGSYTTQGYGADGGIYYITHRFSCSGKVALDADGNLVGTASDGSTFIWYRQ